MGIEERRGREREARRLNIVRAARKLFYEKGFKDVTVSQIARKAEISKGAVYLYFTSKEEIYSHILLSDLDNIHNVVLNSVNNGKSATKMLEDFAEKVFEAEGKIGLVFGREDYGLYNEEIAVCDIMLKIPTSESYPSLNLSHAVMIVLYSLYLRKAYIPKRRRPMGLLEKKKLNEFFGQLLDDIDYPPHKKEHTKIMFKRIMGRAIPSKWEYHTLMGVLSKTLGKIKRRQGKK